MLRITGAWTKAGVVSCVRVQGDDKANDILFDCGSVEENTTAAKVVLITHGHTDHVGAAVIHARARGLSGGSATYYIPRAILTPLQAVKAGFEVMDGKEIPMSIVPLDPGDERMVTHNVKVRVFATDHRVPSQGYALFSLRPGKLLPQYASLPPAEIGRLRKAGTQVCGPAEERLEMVYTGDTTFQGLLQPENRFIFTAPVLIMEMTYLDGDVAKATSRGHVHLQDVVAHAEVFENQQIVFVHLSQKYGQWAALQMLREGLPPSICERALVSLRSFGSKEVLTSLAPSRRPGAGWARPTQGPRSADAFRRKQRRDRDAGEVGELPDNACC